MLERASLDSARNHSVNINSFSQDQAATTSTAGNVRVGPGPDSATRQVYSNLTGIKDLDEEMYYDACSSLPPEQVYREDNTGEISELTGIPEVGESLLDATSRPEATPVATVENGELMQPVENTGELEKLSAVEQQKDPQKQDEVLDDDIKSAAAPRRGLTLGRLLLTTAATSIVAAGAVFAPFAASKLGLLALAASSLGVSVTVAAVITGGVAVLAFAAMLALVYGCVRCFSSSAEAREPNPNQTSGQGARQKVLGGTHQPQYTVAQKQAVKQQAFEAPETGNTPAVVQNTKNEGSQEPAKAKSSSAAARLVSKRSADDEREEKESLLGAESGFIASISEASDTDQLVRLWDDKERELKGNNKKLCWLLSAMPAEKFVAILGKKSDKNPEIFFEYLYSGNPNSKDITTFESRYLLTKSVLDNGVQNPDFVQNLLFSKAVDGERHLGLMRDLYLYSARTDGEDQQQSFDSVASTMKDFFKQIMIQHDKSRMVSFFTRWCKLEDGKKIARLLERDEKFADLKESAVFKDPKSSMQQRIKEIESLFGGSA